MVGRTRARVAVPLLQLHDDSRAGAPACSHVVHTAADQKRRHRPQENFDGRDFFTCFDGDGRGSRRIGTVRIVNRHEFWTGILTHILLHVSLADDMQARPVFRTDKISAGFQAEETVLAEVVCGHKSFR